MKRRYSGRRCGQVVAPRQNASGLLGSGRHGSEEKAVVTSVRLLGVLMASLLQQAL